MLLNYCGNKIMPHRRGVALSFSYLRRFRSRLLYGLLPGVLQRMFHFTSQPYRTHNRRGTIPHPGNRHQR